MSDDDEEFATILAESAKEIRASSSEDDDLDAEAEKPAPKGKKPAPKPDEEAEKQEAKPDEEEEEPQKKPSHRDWIALRKARQQLAAREKAMEERVNALAGKAADRLAPFQRIADALESDDWDAFASEVAKAKNLEFKSWNELNGHIVKRFASPEHVEILRLRRAQEDRDKRDAERETSAQKQAQEAQQAQRRTEYIAELTEELKGSGDETIAAAAEDKEFAQAVYQEQAKAWDNATGTTISAETAAKRALAKARKNYERLGALFGDREPNPAKRSPGTKNPRVGSTRTIPTRRAVQAAAGDETATLDQLIRTFGKQLRRGSEESE